MKLKSIQSVALLNITFLGSLLLFIFFFSNASSIQAQENNDCAFIRAMANAPTPASPLEFMRNQSQSSRNLSPQVAGTGDLGATDFGDYWTFNSDNGQFSLQFSWENAIRLDYAVFRGIDRIADYQPVSSTATNFSSEPGIYTVVVRTSDSNIMMLTETLSYSITANYTGEPVNSSHLENIRDAVNGNEFTPSFAEQAGLQVIADYPGNDAQVYFHAQSLNRTQNGNISSTGNGLLLIFPPVNGSRSIQVNNIGLQQAYMTAGDLGLYTQNFTLYIEDFGYNQANSLGNLSDFTDALGNRFRSDWSNIRGVWLFKDCAGVLFSDRTLIIFSPLGTESRDFTIFGAGSNNDNCPYIYLMSRGDSELEQGLCFIREAVRTGSEISYQNNILEMQLQGERSLEIESSDIRIGPLTLATASNGVYPIEIFVGRASGELRISIDWFNIAFLRLRDGQLGLAFQDAVRRNNNTVRPLDIQNNQTAAYMSQLEALDDIIRIVYSNGQEHLLLPEAEGYIELITPSGNPVFTGQAFLPTALPYEPGYQPRHLNNLGAECYPVNTALPEANCTENGQVNPANGNLWYAVTDFSAEGTAVDLSLIRSYNSLARNMDGPFGFGWTTNFLLDYNVDFDNSQNSRPVSLENVEAYFSTNYRVGLDLTWVPRNLVMLRTTSGSLHSFIRRESNLCEAGYECFVSLSMPGWWLSRRNLRDSWVLHETNGYQYEFDRAGRLRAYGTASEKISINYPWSSALNGPVEGLGIIISDAPSQRQIELYFDNEHHIVRSLLRDLSQSNTAEACEVIRNCFETVYSYENGLLRTVRYADASQASYAYDTNRALIWHDDSRAAIAQTMQYNYEAGQIAEVLILENGSLSGSQPLFVWRRFERLSTSGEQIVTVTDENGNRREFRYRIEGNTWDILSNNFTLLSQSSPLAAEDNFENIPIEYSWSNGLLVAQSPRNLSERSGRADITYTYDTGFGLLRGIERGSINNPARQGLPSFEILYEPNSALPSEINLEDGNSSIVYSYSGEQLISLEDGQRRYEFAWDSSGRLLRVEESLWIDGGFRDTQFWEYSYDSRFPMRLATRTRKSWTSNDAGYTLSYEWDALGRLIALNDNLGNLSYRIAYEFDPNNQTTAIHIWEDIARTEYRYIYNQRGQLIELQVGDSAQLLARTTYQYDVLGRLVLEQAWLLGEEAVSANTVYQYRTEASAASFDRVVSRNQAGREQTIVYDALGRVKALREGAWEMSFSYHVDDVAYFDGSQQNAYGLRIEQVESFNDQEISRTSYRFDNNWQLRNIQRNRLNSTTTQEWTFFASTNTPDYYARAVIEGTGIESIEWTNYRAGNPESSEIEFSDGANPSINLSLGYGAEEDVSEFQNLATNSGSFVLECPLENGASRIITAQSSLPMNCDLEQNLVDKLVHLDALGRVIFFYDGNSAYTLRYQRSDDETGGWRLFVSSDDGLEWQLDYDSIGRLRAWLDERQVTRLYSWDSLHRLIRFETYSGETLVREASFSFSYSLAGFLTNKVSDTGAGTNYVYDQNNRLLLEQDLITANSSIYTYDFAGRLETVSSASGAILNYRYDAAYPNRLAEIASPGGRYRFEWLEDSSQYRFIDALGNTSTYYLNPFGLISRIENAEGIAYQVQYDADGRVISITGTDGDASRVYNLGYTDNLINITSPNTNWNLSLGTSSNGYLQMVAGGNEILSYDYNSAGYIESIISNSGLSWTLNWDSASLEETDIFGNQIERSFDVLGRLSSYQLLGDSNPYSLIIEYQDNSTTSSPDLRSIVLRSPDNSLTYTFDAETGVIVLEMPERRIIYRYDSEGRLSEIDTEICQATSGDCENSWDRNEQIIYDLEGRPIRLIDAMQGVESFSYDSMGNLVVYQDKGAQTYRYTYDAANRLISITWPDGLRIFLEYRFYNLVGICRSSPNLSNVNNYQDCQNSGGVVQSYSYDSLGRLIQDSDISHSYGTTIGSPLVQWSYSRDGANQAVSLDYNRYGLGLVDRVNLSTGSSYVIEYLDGDTVRSIQTNTALFSYGYTDGFLSSLQANELQVNLDYAENRSVLSLNQSQVLEIVQRPNGLIEAVDFEGGNLLQYAYGAEQLGLWPMSLLWSDGFVFNYRLDRNFDVQTVDHLPAGDLEQYFLSTRYSFNSSGILTQQRIINNAETDVAALQGAEGYLIVRSYDQRGLPVLMRINDTKASADSLIYLQTFSYNENRYLQRESRQYQDGTQLTIDYVYDGINLIQRLVSIRLPNGSEPALFGGSLLFLSFLLLRFGRSQKPLRILMLVCFGFFVLVPFVSAQTGIIYQYEYDELGNLSRVTANGQECVSYAYDAANRLQRISDSSGRVSQLEYDLSGRLLAYDDKRFVYLDDSLNASFVQTGNETEMSLSLQGLPLILTSGEQVLQLINNQEGELYGTRILNDEDGSSEVISLFDPLGRYLVLSAPAPEAAPCTLFSDTSIPEELNLSVSAFNGWLWSQQDNLYFADGFVYSPELGRSLQRDIQGPPFGGYSNHEYLLENDLPFVAPSHPEQMGLELLEANRVNRQSALHHSVITQAYLPNFPTSSFSLWQDINSLSDSVEKQALNLASLPAWLNDVYNAPSAIPDFDNAELLLANPAAPSLNLFGRAGQSANSFAFSFSLQGSNQQLLGLLHSPHPQPIPLRTYVSGKWIPELTSLDSLFTAPEFAFDWEASPALVLERLPQAYGVEANPLPALLLELDNLSGRTGIEWIEESLEADLPQLPPLPSGDLGDWREDAFGADIFGLQEALNSRMPAPYSGQAPWQDWQDLPLILPE